MVGLNPAEIVLVLDRILHTPDECNFLRYPLPSKAEFYQIKIELYLMHFGIKCIFAHPREGGQQQKFL